MHLSSEDREATAIGVPVAQDRVASLPTGIAQALALGPVLIFCDQADFTPSYVSPNVTRILGYQLDQVVGVRRFFSDHLHPDDAASVFAALQAAEAARQAEVTQEYRLRCGDGQYRWFLAANRLLYGADGELAQTEGYLLDITDRKATDSAATQAAHRYRLLVESASDIVFGLAADGTITELNPAFEHITGRYCQDWIGQPFAPLIDAADLAVAQSFLRQVAATGRPA